jgi:hypothetical protein
MSEPDTDLFPVTMPFPVTAPSARYSNAQCASLRDFKGLIKDLRPRDADHVLVFRGQTREYQSDGIVSLIPATRRSQYRLKPFKLKLKGYSRWMAERMYDEAIAFAERVRQAEALGVRPPEAPRTPWMHAWSTLVPHYCSGTNGLDVTFQADIALWFACHEAERTPSGIRHRPVTLKDIESGLAPVIYVIECLKPQMGRNLPHPSIVHFAPDLSDLRELMPDPDVRRQAAAVRDTACIRCGRLARKRRIELRCRSSRAVRQVCGGSNPAHEVLGKLPFPQPTGGLYILLASVVEVGTARLSTRAPRALHA